MSISQPFPLILSLLLLQPVLSLRLPFQTVSLPHHPSSLSRRAGVAGSSGSQNSTVPIANTHNAQYIANITLGGQPTPVLLDTGSSDLWVNFRGTPPSTGDLNKALQLNYAVGEAKGHVRTIQAQIDEYSIPDQAFLLVEDASAFSSDIHLQGYDGLLGLGPNSGSVIRDKIGNSKGDGLLERIFSQDKATSNYISFLLDRIGDPTPSFTGQFTISELAPGFENITSMPKLQVDEVILDSDQHWQVMTDKDVGLKGPDGSYLKIKSIVPSAPTGQLVAVIDSGFTFSQVPRDVSDQIYGRVQGAVYDEQNEYWTVPCGQMINIVFSFGGHEYPIHPLDTVNNDFGITDKAGNRVCIGSFQPITSAFSLLGHYDMILGMSFLRNTYTLLDFGDWVKSNADRGNPYVQLLSVTDANQAKSDFITARLGGKDTTSDAKWQLLPADQMQHSPISEEEKKKRYQEMVLSRWPYIFVGCLVFVLIIIGLIVRKCCQRRRARRAAAQAAKSSFGNERSYVQLQNQGGASSVNLVPYPPSPTASTFNANPEAGYKHSYDYRR